MRSLKLLPSNSGYAHGLGVFLTASVCFFTWYGASGTFHDSVQSLRNSGTGHLREGFLLEEGGKLLLWADGERETDSAEWFDMTDSLIDPRYFCHGIGKDSIPSIDAPEFVSMDDPRLADLRITMATRVFGFAFGGEARAYPVRYVSLHEVVNDTFGDVHLTVAWSPLAQLAVVYSRELDGQEMEFGTSGYTMDGVFVLYDRMTYSLWYPLGGGTMDAVAGELKGTSIPLLAAPTPMRLEVWLAQYPNSKVLLPTPYSRTVHQVAQAR